MRAEIFHKGECVQNKYRALPEGRINNMCIKTLIVIVIIVSVHKQRARQLTA